MRLKSYLAENSPTTLEEIDELAIKSGLYLQNLILVSPGIVDCDLISSHCGFSRCVELTQFKIRNAGRVDLSTFDHLKTLKNFPTTVGDVAGETGRYSVAGESLENLVGLPIKIDGDFTIYRLSNKIPLLRLLLIKGVKSFVFPNINVDLDLQARIQRIFNKHYKGGDRSAIIPCQDELIENGYEWAAKL